MIWRKEKSNAVETFSVSQDLPTAGNPPEQSSRDELGKSAHEKDVCDSHGSINKDLKPCSDDHDDSDVVIRTKTDRLKKSAVTS